MNMTSQKAHIKY